MPRIKNGPPAPPPIKDERTVETRADKSTRDKAAFDNGRVRYDWDNYTDAQGDHKGKIGLGHDDGTNDVYGKLEFNEDTGHLKGSLRGERHLNENVDVRGTYGRYDDGDQFGEVGATLKKRGARLDVDFGANERTNRRFGKVKGRYKVGDNTTLRGAFNRSIKNTKKNGDVTTDTWKLGARHRLGTGHHVDGEFGRSTTLGRYGRGEWLRKHSTGEVRDRLNVEHSEKKGFKASYDGHQELDDGYLKEKLRYADGNLKAEVKGRQETEAGYRKGVSHLDRREDGRWSGDVGGEIKDGKNLVGGRVRKDLSGTKKVKGVYGREINSTLDAKVTANADSKGRWDLTGETAKRFENDYKLNNKFRIDSKGKRSYTHRLTKSFPSDRARIAGEFSHDSEGMRKFVIDGGITSSKGRRHEADAMFMEDADGVRSGKVGYDFNDRRGFKAGADIGYRGDERTIGVDLEREHENRRGSERLGADWSSKHGLEAKGSVVRKLDDDTTVSASVGRNMSTGEVKAEGAYTTMLGEDNDINLTLGARGSSKDDLRGMSVGTSRRVTDDKHGFGLAGAYATDVKKESLDLGGRLSSKSLFGLGETSKAGFGGGVEVTKRAKVGEERGAIGTLRKEVLESQGEDAAFVRYGMKTDAKADVGVKIPVGVGYVDTGYKRGSSYEVEWTRLETDPKIGTRPDLSDLDVPGDAEGLIAMNAGESFAIKGSSSHAVRGGAGLGTSVGASSIGDVGLRAGGKMTYAIKGNTRTEVTRGGDNSARMVVKATDYKTKGAGIEVFAGLNPNLPNVEGLGPVGDVATGLATGMIKKWVSVGASKTNEKTTGDERLLDARIDLNHDEAKAAYATAMKGDWSDLEALSEAGHPGVQIDKSIITEIKAETKKLEVSGFGMSYDKAGGETLKSSDVTDKGRTFQVDSDLDTNAVKKDGWFVDKDFQVHDFSRDIEATDGESLGRRKAEERWLGWSNAKTDSFTSKEEVQEQLALARFVAGDDLPSEMGAYEKKIGKLKSKRKLWVGPRNELKKTEVETQVMISDTGLDRLSGKTADEIWSAMSKAQTALNGDRPSPDWTDTDKRNALAAGVSGFNPHTRRRTDELFEKRSYGRAQDFVTRLTAAAQLPEAQRNDAIRQALADRPRDSVAIATMVELLGRDVVDLKVSVDSNAGKKGSEYDFDFKSRGEAYDVQKTVFGSNL